LAVFGADRILFAVDHPFSRSAPATDALRRAPLSEGDRAKIAYRNAGILLGL
jgi:predicted TIM-barrel fold metal-dependent hydrolase